MSVSVRRVNYKGVNCKEQEAADYIASLFEVLDATGSVLVANSATVTGGIAKDLDIVLIGHLDDYLINNFCRPVDSSGYSSRVSGLCVKSFCLTIEVKGHPDFEIDTLGQISVSYGKDKNVSDQSIEQRNTLYPIMEKIMRARVFVSNMIWMRSADRDKLVDIRQDFPCLNLVIGDFSLDELFCSAALSSRGIYDNSNHYVLSCGKTLDMTVAEKAFIDRRTITGSTRDKVEAISRREAAVELIEQDKLSILKGNAGTGKTIKLMHFARKKMQEKKRCLFITYNQALVSDMTRLAVYCDFPMTNEGLFDIMTMHAYLRSLILKNGFDISKDETIPYETRFRKALNTLADKLEKKSEDNGPAEYDYILIDEAQDWSDLEMEIITKLYNPASIVIADGLDQFVRNNNVSPWDRINNSQTISLTHSLRQKSNLVDFVNQFADQFNLQWRLEPSKESQMQGGQIVVTNYLSIDMLKEQIRRCEENQNSAYDLLFLLDSKAAKFVTPRLDLWYSKGIKVYDGITYENRSSYATLDEIRMYNYNSCRGLEGWCAVCYNLDRLVQEKESVIPLPEPINLYDTTKGRKERQQQLIYSWLLMPLTRAIDTLVITIDKLDSPLGAWLTTMAEHNDYIKLDLRKTTVSK